MARFRVHEQIVVNIITEPIEAETPHSAYYQYRQSVKMDQLVRDIVGTAEIAEISYAERRLETSIELLGDGDHAIAHIVKLSEDDLEEYGED
jgi:hypothetical protein